MKPKLSASVRATLNLRISAEGKSDSLLEKEIFPENKGKQVKEGTPDGWVTGYDFGPLEKSITETECG